MRRLFLVVAGTAVLACASTPAAQQTTATPQTQNASEERAVRAVVDRLFDGMRTRDTTMMRSVFADEAQFYGLGRNGDVAITTPTQFITGISQAPPELVLDEVLHDVEIRIDGPLAVVWTYYDFFTGDDFSHCGYDAMQMLKVRGEWKIVALADTRRTEGCRQQR
ncbi:MAG TPA: nuclear transport factor 2 family protein [Longimicrobiales bacterium]|nr:nuclear transport factor 2 family protein [Longimicrobiales bacterium]